MSKADEYRKRRDARLRERAGIRMDDDLTWITTAGGHHIPLDENGIAVAGAGGTLKGKDFSKSGQAKMHFEKRVERAKKDNPKLTDKQARVKASLKNGSGKTNTKESNGEDSMAKHMDKDGNLTKERENLHEQVLLEHLEGVEKAAEGEQRYIFMGGGPASGKSTALKSLPKEYSDEKKIVTVDSDGCKAKLPEYQQMVSAGDDKAAAYAHEESSALSKRISSVAAENGYNVMMDGVGDGSAEKMIGKIREAREHGAKVEGIYCTVPTNMALERATARGQKTGRVVPEDYIRETHAKVSQIFPRIAPEFDSVSLYDTSSKTPVLIARGGKGKLEVVDKKRYEEFLAKGEEKY